MNTRIVTKITALMIAAFGQAEAIGGQLRGVGMSPDDLFDVDTPCSCGNGKAKIWGPGGPHTALVPVAELFNEGQNSSNSKDIEICYGPESTWRDDALKCAGGLMTAAEQQTAGMMRVYAKILKSNEYKNAATPVTMHKATLLVTKGNPKNITSFNNLLERDDVGLVIVDGVYHDSLTSGTALWEDVVGRTKRLEDTANLRKKVCYVASGAGSARDALMDNPNCDAWIYWNDWAVENTDKFDEVPLPEELEIYRDLNIIPTNNTDGDVVEDFINFVLTSDEADNAMEDAGWKTDWN